MYGYQKIIALVVSIVVLAISFILFSIYLINISVDSDYIEFDSDFVKDDVTIETNYFGIPFIEASNESDLFYAVGYFQAGMRMWQMDYYRRLASGRLSEIFGKSTVKLDKFMRCFEMEEICRENYKSLSAKSKSILEAYSKGVNDYIDNNYYKLPLEFNALNYKPAKWMPYHSLMVGKYLTFELSLSIWADLTFGEILGKVGPQNISSFIPDETFSTTIYDSQISKETKDQNFSKIIDELNDIKELIGINATSYGSNAWSISTPIDSLTKNNILANDAHLLMSLPSRWIQMKIKSPEIEAFGVTIPGIPLIMSGRNQKISWGVTNIMVDGFDYFVEKLDNKQEKYLDKDSSFRKIKFVIDTILIADSSPDIYYIRKTERSSLISDFHVINDSLLVKSNSGKKVKNQYLSSNTLSFNWIGNEKNDELFALYKINVANDFSEFKYALRYWSTPGLNFHYIDKYGNTGVISSATIPVRDSKCNPMSPNKAWEPNSGWIGTQKLNDSLFSKFNSNFTFTASANNKLMQSPKTFISNYWEPDSRIKRIEELLNESDKYTFKDAKYMQNDFLSPFAKEIVAITNKTIGSYRNLMTDDELLMLDSLNSWDFIFSRASNMATFFSFFYQKLAYNIFYDELGDRLFRQYTFISSIITRKIQDLLNSEVESGVFDIQGTTNIENKDFILFKSFRDAVFDFNGYFSGVQLRDRHYGKIHKLTLEHPFSRSSFLKYAVESGPYEMGGTNTTINNGEWNLNEPFKQSVGASMRIINDLTSNISYTALPGGISGDPVSPNYTDQLQIWLNGGYVRIFFDNNKNELKKKIKIISNN